MWKPSATKQEAQLEKKKLLTMNNILQKNFNAAHAFTYWLAILNENSERTRHMLTTANEKNEKHMGISKQQQHSHHRDPLLVWWPTKPLVRWKPNSVCCNEMTKPVCGLPPWYRLLPATNQKREANIPSQSLHVDHIDTNDTNESTEQINHQTLFFSTAFFL